MNPIKKLKIVAFGETDNQNFVYVLYANGFRYRGIVSLEAASSLAAAAESAGLDWRVLDSMSGVGILA